MIGDDATRAALKTELERQVEAWGPERCLFPSQREPIDEIVQQLESVNPIPHPLSPDRLPSLFGNWQLIYASRGTVVTRSFASIQAFGQAIKIKRVWQRLVAGGTGKISACNSAALDLPLLGEWQLQALGVWTWGMDEQVAKVKFDTFFLQATQPFGLPNWSLPQLTIPVLEFLQNEALWTTSYLDSEVRVGRGATGNLFVFRRE
ncbi:PAP fibrillin [cyanobacterium TDX16]|nr:PAP fibrillin [cyanobacterium TDX16]